LNSSYNKTENLVEILVIIAIQNISKNTCGKNKLTAFTKLDLHTVVLNIAPQKYELYATNG